MALAAGVPIVAFLLVAAVGAKAPTTPLATAMSVGFLLLSTGFAFAVAWRQKTRARSMAMVGVASSLAVFTAAYLIASWADPESITLWAQPLPFIGEAAMLSLTLGATGGTLSVELARAARVIAFIQILMTVTVVVAALTWGWRRLLRSREEDTARQ